MTATFACRSNSHPFQERRVSLTEPAKIGRSVARARPAANNAVFDCKVLSRNHALLWYEDGKFYLKDTKSSNGTFVNNQRLSKGAEESLPFEINSGDIVQFGVDVVENSRRVTHGCIVSQVRLYLPNGEEAKQSDVSLTSHILDKVSHSLVYPTIQSQDLYQLHQYLQEALHREQMLEQKLALLQRLVADSHETSEKGWQALIDEDKLLSRLEFLENQLQTYAKTLSEESTQKELLQLQEEKHNYETTSKETLRQALGEKLEAQQKLGNLERSYSNSEDECTHLQDVLAKTQKDLKELTEKHQKLTEKAQETEKTHLEEKKRLEQENENHVTQIQRLEETEKDLQRRLEDSITDVEKCQMEIDDLKGQIDEMKQSSLESTESKKGLSNSDVINGPADLKDKLNDILAAQDDGISLNDIKVTLKEDNDIEVVKTIELCEQPSEEKINIVNVPVMEYDGLQTSTPDKNGKDEDMQDKILIKKLEARISQLEQVVNETQNSLKQEQSKRLGLETDLDQIQEERESEKEMLTETTRALQNALSERESLMEREENLKTRIEESEKLLKACETDSISSSSGTEDIGEGDEDDDLTLSSLVLAKAKMKELKKKLKEKDLELASAKAQLEMSDEPNNNADRSKELDDVKLSLDNSTEKVRDLEAELSSLRSSVGESNKLQLELEQSQRLTQEQIQLTSKAENDLKDLEARLEKETFKWDNRVKELEDMIASSNEKQENYNQLLAEKAALEKDIKDYVNEITTLKQFKKDSEDLVKKNEKLITEKQQLLDDMQSLKEKLDKQQESSSKESSSDREQELEEKLKVKQEEVESVNQKFSELVDEQQKLLNKVSQQSGENSGFGNALLAAVLAVLLGIGYLLWQSR